VWCLLFANIFARYKQNRPVNFPPISQRRVYDFGPVIGPRATYLYELPEVDSIHSTFDVPSVSARFGTAPEIWNIATRLMAMFAPRSFLTNRAQVTKFVEAIEPVVRAVDKLVGGTTAMRVDVRAKDGRRRNALWVGDSTASAAGQAAVGMALEMLNGSVRAGVLYPEEAFTGETRQRVLDFSASTAGRPSWDVPFDFI